MYMGFSPSTLAFLVGYLAKPIAVAHILDFVLSEWSFPRPKLWFAVRGFKFGP
jgi:hypothetical protein